MRWKLTAAIAAIALLQAPASAEPAPWLPVLAGASSLCVPGLGQLALGDLHGAGLSLGLTALPLAAGSADLPPTIFADLPDQRSSLWLLTAQEAWFVQAHLAFQEGRELTHNAGFPQPLHVHSVGDLIAAPISWSQLSDWRIWATVGLALASNILLDTLLPEPTNNAPELPTVFQARSASLYGLSISPGEAYGANAGMGMLLAGHAAVGEESLFRGFFQDELERDTGPIPALLLTSALFGASHIGGINQTTTLKQFLGPGLGGLCFGLLYQS
ncbi:MAG TPA: CPBP family intramembrane glutamic endopeptidase, partial [Oscillatoriaceae cyanobacterium]